MCKVVLVSLLIGALHAPLFAHQQKTAISQVLFHPRTENIEVSHRFYMHDAEHAAKEVFGKEADIINSETTQQAFAKYVSERFSLIRNGQHDLPLALIGYEVEGRFFWVYQETNQPVELDGLSVRHDALRDIWPSQVNTINIEGKGVLKTLTFDEDVELLKVTFSTH